MTNEELQAMLAAAYGGQMRPADMGLNAEPRSEWESYKYNMANPGRTAGEVQPKSMGWGEYAQEWYDRLIGTPLKGMTGAGDALLGRSNPDLESFEKNVLDALSLYTGPSVLGRSSATRLNIFGGINAKEAPLRMRDIAEKALAAGKDPDEVWKYTGWKPGSEGKMRFEIDDRAMKFTPDIESAFIEQKGTQGLFKAGEALREGVPLPKAIDHPGLYQQYPELAGVTIKADHAKGAGASFDESTMTIHVPKEGVMLGQQNSYLDSITHEIQHWVQQKEGFARGGSADGINSAIGAKRILEERINELKKEGNSELSKEVKLLRNAIENPQDNPNIRFAQQMWYERLAGEIESSDASARRTWDTDMRRAVPPDMRKDAIIRMGEGGEQQMSVDVRKAYNESKVISGGSSVEIAVLRDKLGLSQAEMENLLTRASRDGDVVMALGEPSVSDAHIRSGDIGGNLLVRLDDSFFKRPDVKRMGESGGGVIENIKTGNPDTDAFVVDVLKELNY